MNFTLLTRHAIGKITGRMAGILICMPLVCASLQGQAFQSQQADPPRQSSTTEIVVPVDGLDWDFDAYGNLLAVYSTYTQTVIFPDRQGIRKAQVIAEEKAKAAIVRYMKEHVATGRIVEEIDSTAQTSTQTQTGGKSSLNKESTRKMSESVKEFTGSFAHGTLSGVSVLEQGYNDKTEEAWVKVGYSMRTKAIADQMRNGNSGNSGTAGTGSPVPQGEVRSRSLPK
jgi:hypothetical protein